MITLITGAPGTGKSAALVAMLEELGQGRQLYVNGIPELAIPHEVLDEPERWPELVPDGAVIIIDEVQRVWRPRGPGQKVPDHVAALETHRHRGLDVYVITQGPNLVDSNVRALVGRHVHLRDLGILGRWWYEWPECADNCRTGWKNAPIKKRYRLPKRVFAKYKSASMHVKPVRSVPWMLVVMIAALGLTGFLGWKAWKMIQAKVAPAAAVAVAPAPAVSPGPPAVPPQAPPATAPAVVGGPPDERADFAPRLSDRPWTAPAYDHLRHVVHMPTIAGALCIRGECACFAGDGSRLPDVGDKACRDWMQSRPFNPYVLPPPPATARAASAGGTGAAGSPSSADQTAPAPAVSATVVPLPAGVSNPIADAALPRLWPPGSPALPLRSTDAAPSSPPLL
ncbi:zonular occludens toxin family protein [Pulveribacter suum]|uniref:Zonular occludens toxin n=1 Tax=Pulveribacter suum TaxID=2116657 RepID=A0A2P1NLB9_9BURK|nr:zonular occludens toxin domain-containing protein [Pulveribacter suum]AVP57868.1 zonular occludens toxin [Pulveribacter suum]